MKVHIFKDDHKTYCGRDIGSCSTVVSGELGEIIDNFEYCSRCLHSWQTRTVLQF